MKLISRTLYYRISRKSFRQSISPLGRVGGAAVEVIGNKSALGATMLGTAMFGGAELEIGYPDCGVGAVVVSRGLLVVVAGGLLPLSEAGG